MLRDIGIPIDGLEALEGPLLAKTSSAHFRPRVPVIGSGLDRFGRMDRRLRQVMFGNPLQILRSQNAYAGLYEIAGSYDSLRGLGEIPYV